VPTSMSQATQDIADRARGFGIKSTIVDGNDVLAVYQAALSAANEARNGKGPVFIECKTVRWERHSAFSAGRYESSEDAQKWKQVDPIPRFEKKLKELGVPASRLAEERSQCQAEVASAVNFALKSPIPDEESIYDGVFAE
jgi:acetoin:2,6-dichlorophenolindophenol oxidoreductase subunit alpha